jgi:hypothetical protein
MLPEERRRNPAPSGVGGCQNPGIGYFLNTIGNDRDVFEHDYWPPNGHLPIPWF